jgi:hypothetical protein
VDEVAQAVLEIVVAIARRLNRSNRLAIKDNFKVQLNTTLNGFLVSVEQSNGIEHPERIAFHSAAKGDVGRRQGERSRFDTIKSAFPEAIDSNFHHCGLQHG